ncbi:hypothetical protein BU204_37925, partial [Actinophytocola xanthii]
MSLSRFATRTAALLLAVTAVGTAATATTATTQGDTVAPAATEGVTVVAEAILASTPFEQAAASLGAATTAGAAAATTGCQNNTYALSGWRMSDTFTWYYNPAGAPASVAATALPAIKSATTTLFTA